MAKVVNLTNNGKDSFDDKQFIGKKKQPYNLNDKELMEIYINPNMVVKLLQNDNGLFVDFRKYYKGYPTQKGLRFLASKMIDLDTILIPEIKKIVNINKENEDI